MAGSKRDQAYEYLRRQIVLCRIKPGEPLDEKLAAQELGFSRMPVREAVNRLAEEHLVSVFPSRGVIVNQISIPDFQEMLDIRMLVEPYLLHKSLPNLVAEDLRGFRDVMTERIENPQVESDSVDDDFDYRFHMYFAEKAGGRYLISMMSTLMTQSQRIRFFAAVAPQRLIEAYREHVAIIDAALAGDLQAGTEAIMTHLRNTREGYDRIYHAQEPYFRN
ncbi:GntR family transcriptional regulator [Bifidobacterium simiarum]|uniref:GntR family transcriptional regulator n=1 Tax=Bifidobacterium simiarum TaxID=2045441 RepID=UPI001BDBB334|nr:GntR family transcriptional regulator [Bifidobacterium simiarum]MBT1166595.1 GntR family transcriptional regulator [Bifidobacterium simiarum]